ncbi:MAG TPA: rRNA maturation RNase YbeY [Bacteroidales bacterium]|nr:rRNA maturation RNase YbeY [Bacteroidales bacterium]
MNSKIQFFSEDTAFNLKGKLRLRKWIQEVIASEQKKPWYINFIFCSDVYLLELNKTYLKHSTFTDVITFPYEENETTVSGDIFISIERVEDNAFTYGESFDRELHRVMIHGVLHLLGYEDKSADKKKEMTAREDLYLAQL